MPSLQQTKSPLTLSNLRQRRHVPSQHAQARDQPANLRLPICPILQAYAGLRIEGLEGKRGDEGGGVCGGCGGGGVGGCGGLGRWVALALLDFRGVGPQDGVFGCYSGLFGRIE